MDARTPHIIGLTGPAGSGKDTVAALLSTHCGAHTLAFADELRNEIADAFCVDHGLLTHRETKEHPLSALAIGRCLDLRFINRLAELHQPDGIDLEAPRSPRQVMQWWGTEYRRGQHAGYWIERAEQRVRWLRAARGARLIVITDVRFADEAALVRRLGGQLWQITRPGTGVAAGAHVSEVTGEQFHPEVVIHNLHDIRHLQQVVLSAWAERLEAA